MRKSHSFWVLAESFWAYLSVEFGRWRVAGILFFARSGKIIADEKKKIIAKEPCRFFEYVKLFLSLHPITKGYD